MVSSPGPKLGDVFLSVVREICLAIHVLNAVKAKCHQFVSRSDGDVRDHQTLHEAVRGCLSSIGFVESKHCAAGHQVDYSREHIVFQLSLSTTSDYDR